MAEFPCPSCGNEIDPASIVASEPDGQQRTKCEECHVPLIRTADAGAAWEIDPGRE